MVRFRALGAIDLRRGDGSVITAILRQPKRASLLAFLAAAPDGLPRRRDVLVAMFWPEADDRHARDSLSAALGFLRRSLEPDVLVGRGEEEIGIDPSRFSSDVAEFCRAVEEGRDEEAFSLYQGDLLPGLHVQGAAGFEEWLEHERMRLRLLAAGIASKLAERAVAERNDTAAVHYARRAADLDPDDERKLRRLIDIQEATGDRAGAFRTFEQFTVRLAADYGAEPSDETRALVARMRERDVTARERPAGSGAPPAAPEGTTSAPSKRAASRDLVRARKGLAGAAVVIVGFVMALLALEGSDAIDREPEMDPLIVVADLASSDTVLGVTAGAWLRSLLGGTAGVRTLLGAPLAEALRRMRRDPMLPLDDVIAREQAMREGAAGVVTGRIGRADTGYVVTVALVRSDGRLTAQSTAAAPTAADILPALRIVGDTLLDRLAVGAMPRTAVLRPVTTSSLAALIAYTEGDRLRYNALDPRAAVPYYERAIVLDTTFAMAYSQLGGAWNALGSAAPTADTVVKLWRAAIRHADALSPREMLSIQDRMIFAGAGDRATRFDQAVGLYQDFLRLYPDDGRALQSLAWYLRHVGRWEEAEAPALRAIRTGHVVAGVYDELVLAQIAVGKHEAAERSLREWRERLGPSRVWYQDAFKAAAARRDYAAADSLTAEALRDRTYEARPGLLPVYALAIRGRLREARASFDELSAAVEESGEIGPLIRSTAWFAAVEAHATGDTAAALATLHELLRRYPLHTLSSSATTHLYKDLGRILGSLGDTAGASAMLAGLQSNWYIYQHDRHIQGLIHLAGGRYQDAIRDLRKVRYTEGHLPPLGRAYEAIGAVDSAVAVYELFLKQPRADYPAWDAVFLAGVLERLGAIYAARADHALAAARYGLLAEILREADPELQWRATRARELAALALQKR